MARQRNYHRDEEEKALMELADVAKSLFSPTCPQTLCTVGTTTGNFTSITNISFLDLTIDVSECSFSGNAPENWPGTDFLMVPGETIVGDFTSIGIGNTYNDSNLNFMYWIAANNNCE